MVEKLNCEPCYFLSKAPHPREWPNGEVFFCWRTGEYIKEIAICLTGRLIAFPQTSEDLRVLVQLVEKEWRQNGENDRTGI